MQELIQKKIDTLIELRRVASIFVHEEINQAIVELNKEYFRYEYIGPRRPIL